MRKPYGSVIKDLKGQAKEKTKGDESRISTEDQKRPKDSYQDRKPSRDFQKEGREKKERRPSWETEREERKSLHSKRTEDRKVTYAEEEQPVKDKHIADRKDSQDSKQTSVHSSALKEDKRSVDKDIYHTTTVTEVKEERRSYKEEQKEKEGEERKSEKERERRKKQAWVSSRQTSAVGVKAVEKSNKPTPGKTTEKKGLWYLALLYCNVLFSFATKERERGGGGGGMKGGRK